MKEDHTHHHHSMAPNLLTPLSLLLFMPLLSSAVEFWNIDCGSTRSYVDPNNVTWDGDAGYVKTGVNRGVANSTGLDRSLATLRAFPTVRKACYTIPVGKGRKVLASVRFYYGNYDGKAKAPSFELIFEGNDWVRVLFATVDSVAPYEVMYVTKRENTSVCLGRTHADMDPFVNSIELRVLEMDMYAKVNSSNSLYRQIRYALGTDHSKTRFPDDPYDRSWKPIEEHLKMSNYKILSNNATRVYTGTSTDRPPPLVFQHAVTPAGVGGGGGAKSNNLSFTCSYLFVDHDPIYLAMHFSETSDPTGTGERRSFHLYVDGELVTAEFGPIRPPFGNSLEFSDASLKAACNTTFTLVPTADSTLPPLLSALEILLFSEFVNEETNPADVGALTKLQNNLSVLQQWSGDPCLPQGFSWDWINCSTDVTPRVTKLSLSGYGLSGTLLSDFSDLTALEIIDLSNNSLYGDIPEFIAKLPNLKELNLANNNLESIPSSLFNSNIMFNVTGNPALDRKLVATRSTGMGLAPEPSPNGRTKVKAPIFLFCLILLATQNLCNI